jgi:cytochrome c-type biogenesis protein CcmH/NrfF
VARFSGHMKRDGDMTPMKLRTILVLATLFCGAQFAVARYGTENFRLERLYRTFISPCCWRENLTLHDSPMATEIRAQIETMVRSGYSDADIKSALVAQNGKRVLALPEGNLRIWLFLTPLAAALIGFALITLLLKKAVVRSNAPALASFPAVPLEEGWDED